MTESGRHVWMDLAQPKIKAYYEQALQDFSMGDMAHTLHYFLKLLDNMEKIDHAAPQEEASSEDLNAEDEAQPQHNQRMVR
jgi:hypothetical protein